ncbi:hypothetical protein A2704_03680 [Candidatus Kaiserbacteria bacterium RIFCSPHIGHO2_01_FULL_54_36b]|uniref:Uncharacterized protein n=1 Tax=Candidatus Kaiserbacteria bacterium RIFCSPHIGHO2_01_FULL_54_36b TaxID=1798483 RepID=A0A1F6CLN3_9BACT|nr:MAG: hypothetical protein A2704_03680 [Candidatus Kaiserbacteria bacterium RIFCSPHIGHO2_01_FULL_54_36b]
MRDLELFKILLIVGICAAAIVARYFWWKYRSEKPKPPPQPMLMKTSSLVFIFGLIALLAMVGKPSTLPIANSIMLAIVAAIFVFGISEKVQGR